MAFRKDALGAAAPERRERWRNWAGNQVCAPLRIHRPSTEAELALLVQEARAAGERVKVVGSGHSFTGAALTDGHLVDLSRYNAVLEVEQTSGRVEVQAGITLKRLNEELWRHGLAMRNLGDVAYQTISGAISTGTHGTGLSFGCLATQVVGLRVVTGTGEVVDCSAERDAEVFQAARVGLGAAGIISTVTLQAEPAFNLHAVELIEPIADILDQQDRLIEEHEHFEYFVGTTSPYAFTKRNNRTERPAESIPRWREWALDVALGWAGGNAVAQLTRVSPRFAARVRRILPSNEREDYVDRSYKVYTSERKVRFVEMEYFIPRQHAREALERVREMVARSGWRITMPIEIRWTAPDDIPLSMCHGRETTSIAVHTRTFEAFQPYFEAVETIMRDYDGRPHWGKLHFQDAEGLRHRYPQWDRFLETRRRLDPDGVFANAYLDRVLGPVR